MMEARREGVRTETSFAKAGGDGPPPSDSAIAGPHPGVATVPATPLQTGMLLRHDLDAEAGSYLQQFTCVLEGAAVEVPALLRAWRRLVSRHEALRTGFRWNRAGQLLQDIHPQADLPVTVHDWTEHDPEERGDHLEQLLASERRRGFEVSAPPLHRLALFLEGPQSCRLAWTSHHALLDGRSRAVVLDELLTLLQSPGSTLPPAPSWAEYARWRTAESPSATRTFWRQHLAGLPPLSLPPACGAPLRHPGQEAFHESTTRLPQDACDRLAALCQAHGLTTNTLVQGAWALVLHAATGRRDVVFGAVRACRHGRFPGAEALVGLLINTVPVRVRVDDGEHLLPWLKRLREQWMAIRPHELAPTADVGRWAGRAGDPSLFDTVVSVEGNGKTIFSHASPGLRMSRVRVHSPSHYPLTLKARSEGHLDVTLQHDRRRIGDSAAREVLAQVVALLVRMADRPQAPLAELASPHRREAAPDLTAHASHPPNPCASASAPPAASSPTEGALAGIWERILGVQGLTSDDDFFERGGDSLSVLRMTALVARELGRPLAVCQVQKHRTLGSVAACLDGRNGGEHPSMSGKVPPARPEVPFRVARHLPEGLRLSDQPLERLILTGAEPGVDAAAVSYLPEWILAATHVSRDVIRHGWYGNSPFTSRIIQLPHGRIAVVTLPVFGDELYGDDASLVQGVIEAGRMARSLGARAVSLAGLIPSATGYGEALRDAWSRNLGERLTLTTGHAATVATVVLALRQVLDATGRQLQDETLACVGLGSIGCGVLRLVLRTMPQPRSLILCDVPARLEVLKGLPRETGFAGPAHLAPSVRHAPAEVYAATTILGATNTEGALDVSRLAPGTIVVDDSGPHCFPVGEALERFERCGDVLCLEGGLLAAPGPVRQLSFVPRSLQQALDDSALAEFTYYDGARITGCVLSSLLTASLQGPPVVGLPSPAVCATWLDLLERAGYRASRPRLWSHVYSGEDLERFRQVGPPTSEGPTGPEGPSRPEQPSPTASAPPDWMRQVTVEVNDTRRPYPHDRCVHDLFAEVAAARARDVALVHEGERITYTELEARATGVARTLRQIGVSRGSVVAVHLPRSVEMVATFLGILKAGAAYLPLDRTNPPDRLAFQVRDARARLVIGRDWPSHAAPEVPAIESCEPAPVAFLDPDDPWPQGQSDDLAYVMYTSGTTGVPKGVEIPHRGIVRLVRGADYVRATPSDVFLHLASPAFDASTFEIWAPLLNGARCVLYPADTLDLAVLGEHIVRHGVTFIQFTTSVFNALIDTCPELLGGVRTLFVGGEMMSAEHARRGLEVLPRTRLANLYGPTESTVYATCHDLPRPLPPGLRNVPIGRPIANTRAYVLDDALQPVPPGVEGEICLAGDGLARGYRGRPDQTAEKFVEVDLGPAGLERVYRTGDLGRWLPGGTLECLGRRDRQVKLRGYRIELDEVEAVMRRHPDVREVTVVLDTGAASPRLVAYVEPRPQSAPETRAMAAWLAQALPAYMIPSTFLFLDQMPLTTNGKIDRAALPRCAKEVAR